MFYFYFYLSKHFCALIYTHSPLTYTINDSDARASITLPTRLRDACLFPVKIINATSPQPPFACSSCRTSCASNACVLVVYVDVVQSSFQSLSLYSLILFYFANAFNIQHPTYNISTRKTTLLFACCRRRRVILLAFSTRQTGHETQLHTMTVLLWTDNDDTDADDDAGAQNQISWIRRRDWHILSSGAQMYTNDERFAILHTPGSNTWTLQIKFVQRRDHGMYECQVCGLGLVQTFLFLSFADTDKHSAVHSMRSHVRTQHAQVYKYINSV